MLLRVDDSPVIALNRAVALAIYDTPDVGLAVIDGIFSAGHLLDDHFAHAARADLCRRLDRLPEARVSYEQALALALALARQEPERRFLHRRLADVSASLAGE